MDRPPAPPGSGTAAFTEQVVNTPLGERRYRLFVPARAGAEGPAPLFVVLHGCTQDAGDIARGTRFNQHAERGGFLVLYPEQPATANPQKCWNWFLPEHQARGRGEPGLIADLARGVIAVHPVDPSRVYLAGISAGGAMAVLTAVAYPDLFAAVAVHSGIAYRAARTLAEALAAMEGRGPRAPDLAREARTAMGAHARAVPAFVMHGAADSRVHPANAAALAEQFTVLAALCGTELAPAVTETAAVGGRTAERTVWTSRDGPPVVERWIVDGLAHAWSGGSAEGTWTDPAGPDATAGMVRFLLSQRRA